MADAVIVDDGGSTRIKQLRGTNGGATGQMDQLMEPGNSDNAHGSFAGLRIQFLNADGVPGAAVSHTFDNNVLTVVTIHSDNGQKVTATVAGGGLTLKLASTTAGVEPLVHGKQNGNQRRYVVSNAGAIRKVEVKEGNNTAAPIYDTQDNTKPETASVYTMIVFK